MKTHTRNGVSLRECARQLTALGYPITPTGINKARGSGRVQRHRDGSYNVQECLAGLQGSNQSARQRAYRAAMDALTVPAQIVAFEADATEAVPVKPNGAAYDDLDIVQPPKRGPGRPRKADSVLSVVIRPEPQPRVLRDDTADDGDMAEALRRESWLKVRERELKLAERQGEVVEIAPVNAHVAGMIITARDRLLRIPGEEKMRLARESDPNAIERILMDRITWALSEMKEYRKSA